VPFILEDIVNLAGLQLNFLDVFIATKRINFASSLTHSGEEGLLLQHGGSVVNVFVHVLKAVVAHAADEEPGADVLVLF
jgi:hypothetical protein